MVTADQTVTTALDLAASGWHVMPLVPGSKRPYANCRRCRGHRAGQCPACAHDACEGAWCHAHLSATADPGRIRHAWPSGALVAVATEASGLAVVDVESGGMGYVRDLIGRGVLPPTLCQRSASGTGIHLIYTGIVPTRIQPLMEGARRALDIKSRAAYIRWTGDVLTRRPPAPWPEALGALLTEAPAQPTPPARHDTPPTPGESTGCRHLPGYVARGVEMAVHYISQHTDHGAGSATYGRARAIATAHRDCPGPCGLDRIGAALTAAAVAVGVPEDYAQRQVARGYAAAGLVCS